MLAVRGLEDPEAARAYLRPELGHLHAPEGLKDADRAAARIRQAITAGESILVHGDYDVDGVASAALLAGQIRALGGRVTAFVPHRLRDGYDFGDGGLAKAQEVEASLVVTTDCGTRALAAVKRAGAMGLDVIVTDHHTPGDALPDAFAVVNPSRADCTYPNPALSGTGVAFKLAQILNRQRGKDDADLWPDLDLVGLASVADLVPLSGENRVLVRYGLRAIERSERPGIRSLVGAVGMDPGVPEAGQVGFRLAPPLNAAGRIADADRALRLLASTDPREAESLAEELVALNRERRNEDRRTLQAVLDTLAATYDPDRDFGVVVAGEGWHPGVIGIVASRVVERIHRPVIIVALDGEEGRGSARSVPGFDLFQAVDACGHLLGRYGGHRQAAGMDVAADQVDALRQAFNAAVRAQMGGQHPVPRLGADLTVALDELDEDVLRFLPYFGPFGIGNGRPSFLARGVTQIRPARVVGEGHLKLFVEQGGRSFEGIGFGLANRVSPDALGEGPLDLVFQVRPNTFQGETRMELRLRDVRPSTGGP